MPLDGSRLSDAVVSHVRRLFHGQQGAREAHLLHVLDPERAPREARAQARVHLAALAKVLETAGLRTVLRVVSGDPVARILEAVVDERIDVVAMATHARTGLKRWVWGSVAERVVRACPVSVLLVNPEGVHLPDDEPRYRRVLLALDEQGLTGGALDQVAALASGKEVELTLVVSPALDLTAVRREVERRGLLVARILPIQGAPERAILGAARDHAAELLALSGAPRSPLSPWPLEQVIEAVARRAPCPVLFLRSSASAPAAKAAP